MPYPWHDGETLLADDLNAAIAAAANGPQGPAGAPGLMLLTGYGPPTEDAAEGATYFDLSNGDVWQSGDAPVVVPYHAPAVNLSPTAGFFLTNDSLIATDSAFVLVSLWLKIVTPGAATQKGVFFAETPNGSPHLYIRSANLAVGQLDFYLTDMSGDSYLDVRTSAHDRTVWRHYLAAFDCDHVGMAMVTAVYVNDVFDAGVSKDADGPAFVQPANGFLFRVIGGHNADIADMRIMFGVNVLDGSGHIPEATRRLFIDAAGKPVDPAVATAALGAPCILFSGDAASFGTNQGTGGAFTLGSDPPTDATTSPSD